MRALLLGLVLAATPALATPVRVATLLPYVENALTPLDGKVRVVATVRRDLHHPPTPPIADLGSPHSPSFEALAAADPQVVVGDRALHGMLRDRLARTTTEVVLVDSSSIDTTFDGLVEVGRHVHAEEPIAREVADARRALKGYSLEKPVPTLILFGTPGTFLVVSDRTWLGDLATRLNLKNVGAGVAGKESHPGFVQVSDETLASLRPELVLLVAHGDPDAIRAAFTRRLAPGGAWESLGQSAVRGVHVLPPPLFAVNPGLDVVAAGRHLHELASKPVSETR